MNIMAFAVCFNSLFVGMCFAMKRYKYRIGDKMRCFNSLFVGMCFAIHIIARLTL